MSSNRSTFVMAALLAVLVAFPAARAARALKDQPATPPGLVNNPFQDIVRGR
jgi:hypothetical protein